MVVSFGHPIVAEPGMIELRFELRFELRSELCFELCL
jgi:hypothetical protein